MSYFKIHKLRGDVPLNRFVEGRLKECIERYETNGITIEFPADKFNKKRVETSRREISGGL
jgi:hypothetical protein